MLISHVRDMLPIDQFCYWIYERESIRKQKEAGKPKPFTDDVILQRYRFCNVVRKDDKVSRWLFANWYPRDSTQLPSINHVVAACLARFFNSPSTLEALEYPSEPLGRYLGKVKTKLRKLKKQGTIFNAAYMVRGNDGVDKIASVIDYTIKPLIKKPPQFNTDSFEECWSVLKDRYGFGSFMAGQVVADLRWILGGRWEDVRRWAPMGPGSTKGMNILLGKPVNTRMDQLHFLLNLRPLITQCRRKLPKSITRRMEAIDWQNCCCEFSKYSRCLAGGRAKQRYPGV